MNNNLSSVSIYDNVASCGDESFSKSCIYRAINDLLSINGDVEAIIFCPLCVNAFEYKFSLFEHLQKFHLGFLITVSDKCLCFKECPFCNAKFYGKRLTAKHTLLHHSKVIKELFVTGDSKCTFCGSELNRKDLGDTIKHIEKMHFTNFEKEFREKFSISVSEMTFSEFINSTVGNNEATLAKYNREDRYINVKHKNLGMRRSEEDSQVNCFDFTELQNQLQNIKSCQNVNNTNSIFKNRSILKSQSKNSVQKSVRRVLKFDLPDVNNENKENLFVNYSLDNCDQFNNGKYSLFHDVKNLDLSNLPEDGCAVPNYCSTPNYAAYNSINKMSAKNDCSKGIQKNCEFFVTSSFCRKGDAEFDFQCGKCRKLFKQNLELVAHVKSNHKIFDLNVFKPCYKCAICNARFFKNYYLKKHHSLHKPY